MARLILHRIAATIPVLLLVTAGVFTLIHLTPGDPIDAMMAESVDDSVKQRLRQDLGLDRPLYLQYASWMGRLLQGDLGRSIRNQEPVIENVARRNSAVDRLGTSFALFGICMPNFLLALLLIFFFGVKLRWYPHFHDHSVDAKPLAGIVCNTCGCTDILLL